MRPLKPSRSIAPIWPFLTSPGSVSVRSHSYINLSTLHVDMNLIPSIAIAGLKALAASPTAACLQSLSLSWCNLLEDEGFSDCLTHFGNLTSLDLSWRACSDSTLRTIALKLSQLCHLDVSGCGEVTQIGFSSFGEGPIRPTLTSLVLSWCRGLSDSNLMEITRVCPNLEALDLSLCSNVTDDGLHCLSGLPRLKRLFLSRNRQITEEGMTFIPVFPYPFVNSYP